MATGVDGEGEGEDRREERDGDVGDTLGTTVVNH